MSHLDELIHDYYRNYQRVGNCSSTQIILVGYCAAIIWAGAIFMAPRTTGWFHTLQSFLKILAPVLFLIFCAYCLGSVIIFRNSNRNSGEKKMLLLLDTLERNQIEWRRKDVLARLADEAERSGQEFHLSIAWLPYLVGLIAIPIGFSVIKLIKALPAAAVGIAQLDGIFGKAVTIVEVIGAVVAAFILFVLLESIAGKIKELYINHASSYGVFASEVRQLLLYRTDYLEGLLAPRGGKRGKTSE